MAGDKTNLTHEEIWDDSALIDSWNDALQEYKKYHSIHAKGVTQKDLDTLLSEQAKKVSEEGKDGNNDQVMNDADTKDTEAQANEQNVTPTLAPAAPSAMPPPHIIMASIKDESLKKLLMSWYYAGYYTGLYEGQQQAQQPPPPSQS